MYQRKVLAGIGLLVSAAMLTACTGAGAGDSESSTIKIGFFGPLTGPSAADGESSLTGAKLAVERINAEGGIDGATLELIPYDDAGDPKQGAILATKFTTQDNVVAVVGGSYSPQTMAAAPIFQRAGLPFLSAYANVPITDTPAEELYVYQQGFDGKVQGRAGAVALHDQGARRPAILAIDNFFGAELVAGFKDYAEKVGMEVAFEDTNQFGEKTFDSAIKKIQQSGADSLYLVEYIGEAKQFLESWRRLGGDIPIMSTEGVDSAGFLKDSGHLLEGIHITTNLDRSSDSDRTQDFLAAYEKKTGLPADMVAASCYDAVFMLAEAIRNEGRKPSDIRDGLDSVKDFVGATGTIHGFTDQGQVLQPVQIQLMTTNGLESVAVIDATDVITPSVS